jgi:hypothetical protein
MVGFGLKSGDGAVVAASAVLRATTHRFRFFPSAWKKVLSTFWDRARYDSSRAKENGQARHATPTMPKKRGRARKGSIYGSASLFLSISIFL